MTFTELKQLMKIDPNDMLVVKALGSTLSVNYVSARILERMESATMLTLAQYCMLATLLLYGEKLNRRTFARYCNRLTVEKSGLYNTEQMCKARATEAVIVGDFPKAAQMFLMAEFHATS